MKTTLLTILITISSLLFAQNDTLIIANNYKFKVGLKGLLERGIFELPPPLYGVRDVSEESILSNFGVQIIYCSNNQHHAIESGIYFIKRASYYEFSSSIGSSVLNTYARIDYDNIHAPIKYRFNNKYFYLTVGSYLEYLMKIYKKSDYLFDYYNAKLPAYRIMNLGVTGSLGIEKILTQRISFFAEFEFSSNLTSLTEDESFFYFTKERQQHLQNYGLAMGINYKF